MSLDYDKFKAQEESGGYWASYSDLFMVLSLVFLLLYVVSSLRSGTFSIQKQQEYNRMAKENQDLKEQIKVYSTLKDDYLQTGASQQEQKLYEELMGKLNLLQEEAKDEKDKLRMAAAENEKKEKALNKYQQMIRNIINTNMVAQARIKNRDVKITKRDKVIVKKSREINQLEQNVEQKESQLAESQQQIEKVNKDLEKSIAKLQRSYKRNKITKKKMRAQIAKVKAKSEKQLKDLQSQTSKYAEELDTVTSQLSQAEQNLQRRAQKIASLEQEKNKYKNQMKTVEQDFESKIQEQKQAFQEKLAKQKLSARERLKKQVEFQKQLKSQKAQMQAELAEIQQQASKAQQQAQQMQAGLQKAEAEKQRMAQQTKQLQGQTKQLSKDLKKAKALANAKKILIKRIKNNLKKAGVKASVDERTGDVIISFGDEYFDTGKANLKPGMRQILQKFMPVYAKSLFEDQKTATKIESVEIIGYASPTYKGKYVDPRSLEASSKKAANFNLDLSYYRARSIFDYIFDTSKMKYQHQKTMLPKVSVSGKSFFAEGAPRDIASGMSQREYCKKYDCKKAQRVIIKFDLTN